MRCVSASTVLLGIWLASSRSNAQTPAADSFNAQAYARAEPSAGETRLQPSAAQAQPGALGDAARALGNLPGVARAGFDSGALAVWGSGDAETRVYLDGVELPLLFHPGGFRSSLPDTQVAALTMVKAAPEARFGRNLGANIAVETRALDAAPRATLAVDSRDAAGSVQGSIGPLRVAWSGRLGYLDRLVAALAPRASENLPIPEYADGFAKVQLDLDTGVQLSAAWLGSHDHYVLGDATRSVTQRRALQLGYVRFERRYADRARVSITPHVSVFDNSQLGRSAGQPWQLGVRTLRYGVRAEYRAELELFAVQLGFDAMAQRSDVARSGTLTLPQREGDISVFGQAPGGELARDNWSTHDANLAPYASLRLRLGRWSITPGLRMSLQLITADRALPSSVTAPAYGRSALRVQPEPRLLVRYFASELLQLSARAGVAHQAAAAEDRSALFGNPTLQTASALAVAAGPKVQLPRVLDFEVSGFYRHATQLAARNPATPLPLAAALLPDGRGHSYGVELAVQAHTPRWLSAQLSYTLSRARRQDNVASGERFADFDQTHVLTALGNASLGAWRFGLRARWATGNPRSDVIGGYQNLQNDRFEPIFGAHNAARLPDYLSLDVRIERALQLGPLAVSVWLDVLNVTNRRNVEAVAYSFDYQTRQDVTGLPTLAVLGVRVEH
jgi:hypothetical protein